MNYILNEYEVQYVETLKLKKKNKKLKKKLEKLERKYKDRGYSIDALYRENDELKKKLEMIEGVDHDKRETN